MYKGKFCFLEQRIIMLLTSIITTLLLLYIDRHYLLSLPMLLSPSIVAFILYTDFILNEKRSFVIIDNTNQVILNKSYVFGLLQVNRTICTQDIVNLHKILRFYEKDEYFSIDCINDLAGTKVLFKNIK